MTPSVVFLAGLGRSGTTIIERSLGEVPGISPVGELVHLWHRGLELDERCGCGEPFSRCGFWSAVGGEAFGGWDQVSVARVERLRTLVDRTRHIPSIALRDARPGFARLVGEYADFYVSVYRAVGRVTGDGIVVDSSKHPSLAYVLATVPGLSLRVVHVVRDPRATAYSWTKQVRRPDATQAVEEEMFRYTPGRAAALWAVHNTTLSGLSAVRAPRLVVRFEDFVAQPRAMLRRIASWAGVDEDTPLPISEEGALQLSSAHTVSGNPVRFSTGTLSITPQNDWRRALEARDRRLVTAITSPLLRWYGYPFRVGARSAEANASG